MMMCRSRGLSVCMAMGSRARRSASSSRAKRSLLAIGRVHQKILPLAVRVRPDRCIQTVIGASERVRSRFGVKLSMRLVPIPRRKSVLTRKVIASRVKLYRKSTFSLIAAPD